MDDGDACDKRDGPLHLRRSVGGRAEGGEISLSVVQVGLGRGVEIGILGLAVKLTGEQERSDQIDSSDFIYICIFIGER